MAWNEISLDDLDELTKELQIANEKHTKEVKTKDDSDKSSDSRSDIKSARKEDEDEWDDSDVQADDEDEGDTEVEQDEEDESEDEVIVDEDNDSNRNRGSKSNGKLDRYKSNEAEEVRRALAEVQRERDAALAQLAEAEQAQSNLRKTTLESQRDSIAGEIKTLKAQIKQAKADGDTEAETELLLEVQKKQLRELAIESALEDADLEAKAPKKEAPKTATEAQNRQTNVMPPEAQKFVQRNAWIATAPEAVRMTIVAQSQMLIDQGKDPSKPEFYNELGRKLNTVLEGSGYTVQGFTQPKKAVEQKKSKGSPLPPKEQTTKVYRDANGNTKVVATKADRDMAEKMGLDLKVYMAEKIKMEKATGGVAANWAPIKI